MLSLDASSRSASPPQSRSRIHCVFAALGFGTSWTLGDATWANLAAFMDVDPNGLMLPDIVSLVACMGSLLTVAAGVTYFRCCGTPSFSGYVWLIWCVIGAEVIGAITLAMFWRTMISGVLVVVCAVGLLGALLGTLSWLAIFPFVALHFHGDCVSATMLGSALGSLAAGVLGLVQAAQPSFGPTAFMGVIALLQLIVVVPAWADILNHGRGLKVARPAAASAGGRVSYTAASPRERLLRPESGACCAWRRALGWARSATPLCPAWMRRSIDLWALAVPLNMSTWGFSPNILQFAAAHAGCSCDAGADDAASDTYRLAVSLGFFAMPAAAYASLRWPTHSAVAFVVEAAGAAGARGLSCSAGARATIVCCIVVMRSVDTYVTTMLFRVVSKRFDGEPQLQERAALGMGAVLVFGTSIATLVAFELVREHVIACRLPDEFARLGNAGAPSSSRALHLADFSRQDPLVPG